MPVPKSKEKLYGKIVGSNINRGKSLTDAKQIADRAIDVPEAKQVREVRLHHRTKF